MFSVVWVSGLSISLGSCKYVAEVILKINERKRWTDPPPSDPAKLAAQDEEIFQTARLIKSVESLLFRNFLHWPRYIVAVTLWVSSWVTMLQASLVYLRVMLGTWMHSMYGWSVYCSTVANPVKQPIKDQNGIVVPRGQGNHVSVEFNVLYRVRIYHSTRLRHGFLNSIYSGTQLRLKRMRNGQRTFLTANSTASPWTKLIYTISPWSSVALYKTKLPSYQRTGQSESRPWNYNVDI